MTLAREDITGVVLAGGRGSRMGGVDKGLQGLDGVALALHALRRLAPQVVRVMVNANRHLDAYRAFGVPVQPDAAPGFAGPLAGFLSGLEHCETGHLVTVPCDTPNFPADLVPRLAAALATQGAEIALAATRNGAGTRLHPVFCLMRSSLAPDLASCLRSGERKVDRWTARHRCVEVLFDDARAFFNANTADELAQLQRHDG